MKTTKTFRLLAVLLALVLAFGAMPALAVEIDSGDYAAWTQSAVDDLYGRLMAAENYEDYIAIVETLSETARTAFFNALTEEQQAALEEHAIALTPASEAFEPIVRFTKVGPLLPAPASGARMMRFAARNGGSSGSDSDIVLNKTAEKTDDGYKITLEAYATGSSTTVSHVDPVDIVLVLDVSGSMDKGMYSYSAVYSSDIQSGNRYAVLIDGKYHEVSESRGYDGVWWYLLDSEVVYVQPKTGASDSDLNHVQFYKRSSTKKINALKSAVNGFIDNVAEKSPDSSIAIVKFAGSKTTKIGNDTYSGENYSQIVMNLTTVDASGQYALKSAVNSFSPGGATAADYGMQYAQTIISGAKDDGRKKVVIMFTDGEPNHYSGFDASVANDAIGASKSIKDAGATVYTIGVFSGANGTPVDDLSGLSQTNKYMHLVSSNYKNATNMDNPGTATYPEPKGEKSYFLSAGSAGELNSIFQQISHEVGGTEVKLDSTSVIKDIISPSFTLPTGATAADIKLETYACTGKDANGDYIWRNNNSTMNATATVGGDKVNVTGFDFSKNWCGTETDAQGKTSYRGNKLVISFTVEPKAGFLGGNDVPTNGEESGIYKNDAADKPDWKFEVPTVNVPIKDVTVTAQDKNVYLLGEVTADELKNGATVKVGNVELKLNESNYGLEDWQTAYVTIDVKFTDENGNEIDYADLKDLKADKKYKLTATVSPKTTEPSSTQGEKAETKTTTVQKDINVFMPSLKFQDSIVKYRQTVVNDTYYATNNLVKNAQGKDVTWVHGEQDSTQEGVSIIGQEPEITLTYNAIAGALDISGLVISPADIPVAVIVQIGNKNIRDWTTFEHADCTYSNCRWADYAALNPQFLLHVTEIFGDLTIQKNGLNVSVYGGKEDRESAIFKVEQLDGEDKQTWIVAVNGNGAENAVTLTKLPAGRYRVTEMTDWTWRYASSSMKEATNIMSRSIEVTVRGGANSNTLVECTNGDHNDKWLGGDNYANNKFGSGN